MDFIPFGCGYAALKDKRRKVAKSKVASRELKAILSFPSGPIILQPKHCKAGGASVPAIRGSLEAMTENDMPARITRWHCWNV